jgi:hypothetical protein
VRAGAEVPTHPINLGQGAALRGGPQARPAEPAAPSDDLPTTG